LPIDIFYDIYNIPFTQHFHALHFIVLSGDSPLDHNDLLHVARDAGENTTLRSQI
jgi:hypothetical protein